MFDQLKQLNQLRQLQQQLKEQTVTLEKDGVRVVMRGDFEVMEVSLNPGRPAVEQGRVVADCLNQARQQLQVKLAGMMAGQMPGM